ncbi:MAG: dicarboxylate/amino acid:cation symporter [Treponema sp.]|jgi:Na+/H+-dicarboxylate symporter|nr:dicarboxylate/amino acid:cation symporter [Treponema sp.]
MKVWVKLLVGSLLGFLLGSLLPPDNQGILDALAWLETFAIRIGRYAVPPVMVFSLTITIYELRQDGQFWVLTFRSILFIIGTTVFIISAGIFVTIFFPPSRIPILIDEQLETVSLDTAGNITALFPSNMFEALVSDGVYLFPLCVFAFFLGMGLSYDKSYTRPIISIVDSLSRIFYHIVSFFSEILGIVMIVLAAYWAVRFRAVQQTAAFRDLIGLLGIFSMVLCFGILPLFLYILPHTNPWVILYGSLSQAITSFFSGDINFCYPVLLRHLKENMGVKRRSNAVSLSLFAVFGRAGSAMAAAAAFIVIIKSYSSLGITPADIMAIGVRAFFISFLLARHPGDGAYTALAVLCLDYGRGFEAGYLILKPMAFYLIAIGTFVDVMVASYASFAIARISGFQEDKSLRHFI